MKKRWLALCWLLPLVVLSGCSLRKMALNQVGNALTTPSGGTVFTGDNDPELVGEALPFAIKMYESLAVSIPGHEGLQLRTGSLYIMYANAFLQTPALMMGEAEYQRQAFLYKRAKNLYLRGRDIILNMLERKHPGFLVALNSDRRTQAIALCTVQDVDLLYWAGAGWLAAFAIDPFDMKIGLTLPRAAALMARVEQLDPNYNSGAIHDFYTLYYGSLPDYMGGDSVKARDHFEKAVAASSGKLTSPYLSLATTVAVKEQNVAEFKQLLQKVLAVDIEADPANRLINVLNQRKAGWLLAHIDDLFVEGGDGPESAPEKQSKEETR
jgi:predicted anti-sigma-YlaC factor YlaD